ncbi:MAG: bifunctional phosphoribosyl-AMP cyclohydrolase/phosphoribosyl-ATP diphosphatase HisIE [Rikenellaceae bacterium]|nr:bifunctional phosphoribosyl-AMP cyclohydrolase/phosphoribosyl-ATP diphosphatase HisIE [Rikenellaceae bacterium]
MEIPDFSRLDAAKNADGLVPAIIQDNTTLRVLMLGYMNREAFEKSLRTGRVTFYSRTRGCLWTKGETSGNYLDIVSISTDCDSDTLLVRVDPHGPACHNGTLSCFTENLHPAGSPDGATEDSEGFIRRLGAVVRRRRIEMPEGSYTTKLFEKGVNKIAQKVGEEAVETVIEAVAGNRDGFLYEASDLVYHLLVLMEQMGVTPADMENELHSRHK